MVCSRSGPTVLARIAVMKALNRSVERVFNPDRKDTHWVNGSSRETNNRLSLRGDGLMSIGRLLDFEIVDPLTRAQLRDQPARLLATSGPSF
jgi:hypothetical protein